ncbi:MAG: ADP-ribosylglycohydrolase family protein [Syntrophales bacterium]
MLGAIAGDVIGSVYEGHPIKYTDFPLFGRHSHFTDDTVLTVAAAYAILEKCDYATAFKTFGRKYPRAGYGASFYQWLFSPQSAPYNSWGNGSAMRVSPIGFAFSSIEAVLEEAAKSAAVTHNHPEGIKGAQATALSILLARRGEDMDFIKSEIGKRFAYNLNRALDDIRPEYRFDVSSQGSVPESIVAFLESEDFEDAIRKAVSLGGDSDTMACIAGGIAHAFCKEIPENIVANVRGRLPDEFLEIIDRFADIYGL